MDKQPSLRPEQLAEHALLMKVASAIADAVEVAPEGFLAFKIADDAVRRYRAEVRGAAQRAAEAQSLPIAESIKASIGLREHGPISIDKASRDGAKVYLSIDFKREVDPALAEEIAKFLMMCKIDKPDETI